MADCTQLCSGAAQQPGSPGSSSTAIVDVELLARENPGLVLAQESHHSCSADAQHIAEVAPSMLRGTCSPTKRCQQQRDPQHLSARRCSQIAAPTSLCFTSTCCTQLVTGLMPKQCPLRRQCRELDCAGPTHQHAFWC